jgi:hypothetical protein
VANDEHHAHCRSLGILFDTSAESAEGITGAHSFGISVMVTKLAFNALDYDVELVLTATATAFMVEGLFISKAVGACNWLQKRGCLTDTFRQAATDCNRVS